jgi:hypothetical protein
VESTPSVSFGDNVRVRRTAETESLGLAGRHGQVYGETTPSVTGVTVIGGGNEDYAINVNFDDLPGEYWFGADQLELVDHAPGTEIRLAGIDKRWIRGENGEWVETPPDSSTGTRKPWWKLW